MDITLSVYHKVSLTHEERYALHAGEPQEVIGCSIPVWFRGDKTSEPAKEIFCRYYIFNSKEDLPVRILEDGYEIHLPHVVRNEVPIITNDEWREMSEEEREIYRQLRGNSVTSKNLLNIGEGGSGVMNYREHNQFRHGSQVYKLVHFVNLYSAEDLLDSIQSREDSLGESS